MVLFSYTSFWPFVCYLHVSTSIPSDLSFLSSSENMCSSDWFIYLWLLLLLLSLSMSVQLHTDLLRALRYIDLFGNSKMRSDRQGRGKADRLGEIPWARVDETRVETAQKKLVGLGFAKAAQSPTFLSSLVLIRAFPVACSPFI